MKDIRINGNSWYRLRFDILKRDNFTCQYCGQSAPNVPLEVDHKIAVTDGGSALPDNLVTCCWACNRGKDGLRKAIIAAAQRIEIARSTCEQKPYNPAKRQYGLCKRAFELLQSSDGVTATGLSAALSGTDTAQPKMTNMIRVYLNRWKNRGMIRKENGLWYAVKT